MPAARCVAARRHLMAFLDRGIDVGHCPMQRQICSKDRDAKPRVFGKSHDGRVARRTVSPIFRSAGFRVAYSASTMR